MFLNKLGQETLSDLFPRHVTVLDGVKPAGLRDSVLVVEFTGGVHEGIVPVTVLGPPVNPEAVVPDHIPVSGPANHDGVHGVAVLLLDQSLERHDGLKSPEIVHIGPVHDLQLLSDGGHLWLLGDQPDPLVHGLLGCLPHSLVPSPDRETVHETGENNSFNNSLPVFKVQVGHDFG